MNANSRHLIKLFFSVGLGVIFFTIYQHNLITKSSYERQRLVKKKNMLSKERNDLLVQLMTILDSSKILAKAHNEWGMQGLRVHQICCTSPTQGLDFLGTASNDDILKVVGIYDLIEGRTGGSSVST